MQIDKSTNFEKNQASDSINKNFARPKNKTSLASILSFLKAKKTLDFPIVFLKLSIARKLGYSYAFALGIATLGVTIGLALGEAYQKEALKSLFLAEQQKNILNQLEISVAGMRSHPQRLVPALGRTIGVDYEKSTFIRYTDQVENYLQILSGFIVENQNHLAVDAQNYQDLIDDYKNITERYVELIQVLWQKIELSKQNGSQPLTSQQIILRSLTEDEAENITLNFDRLAEELSLIVKLAEAQEQTAKEQFIQAQTIRLKIIGLSLILAIVISILCAIYTSRSITQPLQEVTQVATEVTRESNFELRANVTSKDELSTLAVSLNQLIQWVGEYTHELQVSRQTLEAKVQERTQELTQALQELKETQTHLIQTEKMSGLGQIVAGIAHEINNPVSFIFGNLEYAKNYTRDLLDLLHSYQEEYPQPSPKIQDQIDEIELEFLREDLPKLFSSMKTGAQRIQAIIQSLRNFSRLDEAKIKSVNLQEGLESTLMILNYRLKNIEVISNYQDIPEIECYPAQLNQVFFNMISNAIDILEEKFTTRKSTEDILSSTPRIWIEAFKLNSEEVQIRIRDNGTGIQPDIKDKLFDPFFTTKSIGKGTGLGLYTVYQIIKIHQGKIEVNSELGNGAEFVITLPIQIGEIEIQG